MRPVKGPWGAASHQHPTSQPSAPGFQCLGEATAPAPALVMQFCRELGLGLSVDLDETRSESVSIFVWCLFLLLSPLGHVNLDLNKRGNRDYHRIFALFSLWQNKSRERAAFSWCDLTSRQQGHCSFNVRKGAPGRCGNLLRHPSVSFNLSPKFNDIGPCVHMSWRRN